MSIFNSDLNISISVKNVTDSKSVVKVVRIYSKQPVASVAKAVKNQEVIFEVTLVKYEFYAGWKNLYDFVDGLKCTGADICFNVNGRDMPSSFVEDLKEKMNNIKREDIY